MPGAGLSLRKSGAESGRRSWALVMLAIQLLPCPVVNTWGRSPAWVCSTMSTPVAVGLTWMPVIWVGAAQAIWGAKAIAAPLIIPLTHVETRCKLPSLHCVLVVSCDFWVAARSSCLAEWMLPYFVEYATLTFSGLISKSSERGFHLLYNHRIWVFEEHQKLGNGRFCRRSNKH
jgi:hypothetical protein